VGEVVEVRHLSSPLYDIYDPDGELRRLAELRAFGENRPYRESLTDLMDEDQKSSLLSKLANSASSGIAGLGWLLDTPGSVVRGTLSGGPSKGLSALWESSDERVTGRELLRQYDLVGEDDNWGNWIAGFAAEVGLDPFTYLNPLSLLGRGAYTNAGKALARSGALENAALLARRQDKGIREYLRSSTAEDILSQYQEAYGRNLRPEFEDAATSLGIDANDSLSQLAASSMEFRLPFAKRGTPISLTGGIAGDALARFFDTAGKASKRIPGVAPIVNRATRFFDTSVMGALDPDSQWRNREAFAQARNARRDIQEQYTQLQYRASTADVSALPAEFGDDLRSFNSQRIQNSLADYAEANGDISKLIDQQAARAISMVPEWQAVRDAFTQRIADAVADAQARGVKLRKFDGASGFFPSQRKTFEVEARPDIPEGRLGKRERRYTSGQRALNLEDNLGRSRDPAYDLPMRRQALRQLMGGDEGRALQQTLLNSDDAAAVAALEQQWEKLNQSTGGLMGRMYGGAEDAIAKTQQRIAELQASPGLSSKQRNQVTRKLRQLQKELQSGGTDVDLADAVKSDRRTAAKQLKKLQKQLQQQQDTLAGYKVKLVDQLRMADTQFADQGLGLFDNSAFQDMLRYDLGRARVNANADAVIDNLARISTQGNAEAVVGGGGITLTQAGERLGFVPKQFREAMLQRHGIDADEMLVTERQIEDLKQLMPPGPPASDSPLGRLYRSFTNAFKIGALANPAYHVRNAYSGQYATASQGIANPLTILSNAVTGLRAGMGNEQALLTKIRNIPRYQRAAAAYRKLMPAASQADVDKEILAQFQGEYARNRLGQGQVVGDVEGAAEAPGLYLGSGYKPTNWFGQGGVFNIPKTREQLRDFFTVRGVDFTGSLTSDRRAPQVTRNPLLQLHESTAARVEDANRMGVYLSALQRGASPDEAARLVFESQIDYSPEAFTAGEAALKRLVPFYSFPRGITPLVASNTIYRPGGLQGQTIRAINSGSRSGEDYFVPEHLRKQVSIPFPYPRENEELQSYLTGIDLPFTGVVNYFTPGTGNTPLQVLLDTIQKTGINLAGDLNPVPKLAIEGLFGKQLYSGRDLNDLYSVFEQSLGKDGAYLEQAVMNLVPGASKLLPAYRTAIDDRLTPLERLGKVVLNNSGLGKLADVNSQQAMDRAARDTVTRLLETTSGARTYENINIPAEELAKMGPQEQEMYLLYRVIQSEASKRARERKRAEQMQDPMQLLGVV